MARTRLDQLLVERGLAESREKAQRLIRAGSVTVDGQPAAKPGHLVADDADLAVAQPERFVSRGGEKLLGALAHFSIRPDGEACLDVGASTGGFTDCLLQHGARRVFAVDVGRNQLHPRIASDPRVVVRDGFNARSLAPTALSETPTFCTIDASFISLTLLLPAVSRCLANTARMVTLIKPQFEAGPEDVGRGGVVRDPAVHQRVIERVRAAGESLGWRWQGVVESPLKGPAGNTEFLAYWKRP